MRMLRLGFAAVAAALFVFSAAQAGPYEDLSAAIANCAAVSGDKAQLACYNQIAARLRPAAQAPAAPSAPAVSTPSAAAVVAATPAAVHEAPALQPEAKPDESHWYDLGSWFASSDKPPPARPMTGTPAEFGGDNWRVQSASNAPEPLDHITAGVKDATYNYFRRFTVTLDNGQVWRQEEGDTRVARFKEDAPQTVTIKRGFMGGYSLSIDGQWGTYQVKRIK